MTRHYHLLLCRLPGLIFLCSPLVIAAPDFEISELDTGKAVEQTVLTPYLADQDAADLLVISVSEKFDKILRLYELQGAGYSTDASVEIPLAEDVIFVDVGRYRQRDIFVTFTAREAVWYDPRSGKKHSLVRYQSIYNTPVRDSMPNLDLFRDINQDGLDDFFIPGYTGVTAYIQKTDGSFSEGLAMYAPPMMRVGPGGVNYQMPQYYLADLNLDGLQDVVFWVDEQLSYYAGLANGLFENKAISFIARVPYQYGSQEDMDRVMNEKQEHSNFSAKALYRFADLDNDEITDLIVISVQSKGVLDKTMIYEIYNGTKDSGGNLMFPAEPVSKIGSKGTPFGLLERDFNGDKKVDFLVPSVDMGVGKIIKGLISSSTNIDLNFYQLTGRRYPEIPNVSRVLKVKFDLSSGQVDFPYIISTDLDADGFEDLIMQEGNNTLHVYSGMNNEGLFEKQFIEIDVDIPEGQNFADPSNSQSAINLGDLNNDKRPDMLIRHDSKTASNRVIVLLSK